MDKFNSDMVSWKDTPDNIKAEIRAAKHVQWNGGTGAWLEFQSAKDQTRPLTKLMHLAYRVKPGTEHILRPAYKPRKPKPHVTLNLTKAEAKVLRRLLKGLDVQT